MNIIMKCHLCNEEIEELFLGKIKGTIVKIKVKGKNELFHVCNGCQKKYGDKLKEELRNKIII